MDYFFYLATLVEAERNKQILTIVLIWLVMLSIAIIVEFIKYKFKKKV